MRKRLLVVEDSQLNRELLVQLLEDRYEIAIELDGAAAVAAATSAPPDGILMDVDLPMMSGLDAVRAIRGAGIRIPIVAVSSGVMQGDRELALEAGCDEFVPKPIDDIALLELLERLVGDR